MKKERKVFRKVFSVLLMVAMVCALATPVPMNVQAASSNKTTTKATVKVTETVTLRVKNPSKRVKWSVNKPKIAKITKTKGNKNSTAIIKGMKKGKAIVTAKIGKTKRKVTITVKPHKHFVAKPATCTQPAKCSCGYKFGAALGHQMAPATCKSPQKCTRCGITTGGKAAHRYSNSHCVWCNQLNLEDFVGFQVRRTANDGEYNVNYVFIAVANIGSVSFEILTSMPATIYPNAGASGIRVYLTDTNDQTYTDANRFVVLPSSADKAWFDTLNATAFTFAPDGVLQFYASYGEHTYLFRVNASKLDSDKNYLLSDYTFTQIN